MAGLLWPAILRPAWSQMDSPEQIKQARENLKRAEEQEAKDVERQYSTKPITVSLGDRVYRMPANYFDAKGRDKPNTFTAMENGFGFALFLPEYGGYTKENWRKGWFDPGLVQVLSVRTVNKNQVVELTDGTRQQILPEMYGDPRARFNNRLRRLEQTPAFKLNGLEGYRWKSGGAGVTWTGARSNGEFFFLVSTLAPVKSRSVVAMRPVKREYYSEQEGLRIAYRYFQDHIAKWREIDDAIWAKLRQWRVK